ncbi:hypothetical protein GQ457_12G015810 [Hibiscus cannabinus]
MRWKNFGIKPLIVLGCIRSEQRDDMTNIFCHNISPRVNKFFFTNQDFDFSQGSLSHGGLDRSLCIKCTPMEQWISRPLVLLM